MKSVWTPAGVKKTETAIPSILLVLVVAAVPYWQRFPLWVIAWCLFFWGFSFWTDFYNRPPVKPWLRQVLIPIGLLGILGSYHWRPTGDVFVGMLAVLLSLKPLEIATHRDRMVTVFLSCFLILAQLLHDNSVYTAFYMLASVCVVTAVLIRINRPGVPMVRHLKLSLRIMAQALPFAIVLFILFPRGHGHYWGVYDPASAKAGFSERLTAGSVSSLAPNREVAFRVDFHGNIPSTDRLYWRGIVFWRFTGREWEITRRVPILPPRLPDAETVAYTITLEPHNSRWWFCLDFPEHGLGEARLLDDLTLASWRRVTTRTTYTLRSRLSGHTGIRRLPEAASLELPPSGNPRSRALAQGWVRENPDPAAVISRALFFFRENGFTYSLRGVVPEGDPIDDFLFRTRSGYCEHYASAFAFLMRAAQIPARIVGGYLGGERNPFGNYLVVRQSDAHAWVEVWLPQAGWSRIDPTLAVAPVRASQGAEAALPLSERPIYWSLPYLAPFYRYWKQIEFAWDRADTAWDLWVAGYSDERQRELFGTSGAVGGSPGRILFWILLAATVVGATWRLFLWGLKKPGGVQKDSVQTAYERFCRNLARIGLSRQPGQGPCDYARQVSMARDDLRAQVEEITTLYVRLRYGRGGDKEDEKRLQKLVKEFKPRR